MLPLRCRVLADHHLGTVIARCRDWPMRYDVRLDGSAGTVLRDVPAAKVQALADDATRHFPDAPAPPELAP
jgi:hypothetical protein